MRGDDEEALLAKHVAAQKSLKNEFYVTMETSSYKPPRLIVDKLIATLPECNQSLPKGSSTSYYYRSNTDLIVRRNYQHSLSLFLADDRKSAYFILLNDRLFKLSQEEAEKSLPKVRKEFIQKRRSAAPKVNDDFRGVNWGETRQAILEKEGEPIESTGFSKLVYPERMLGLNGVREYSFQRDLLVSGKYVLLISDQSYDQVHRVIVDALSKKYGEPYDFVADEEDISTSRTAITSITNSYYYTSSKKPLVAKWENLKTRISVLTASTHMVILYQNLKDLDQEEDQHRLEREKDKVEVNDELLDVL